MQDALAAVEVATGGQRQQRLAVAVGGKPPAALDEVQLLHPVLGQGATRSHRWSVLRADETTPAGPKPTPQSAVVVDRTAANRPDYRKRRRVVNRGLQPRATPLSLSVGNPSVVAFFTDDHASALAGRSEGRREWRRRTSAGTRWCANGAGQRWTGLHRCVMVGPTGG